MVVSKVKTESIIKSNLFLDSWSLKHTENETFTEEYVGTVPMEENNSLLYMGYMLSYTCSNMPNIIHKKNKSIGTQRLIVKLIEPLGCYRFERALIYIGSLLRSSIPYGAETMCNVKETEWRELEKIEESVLSKVFKTTRSCSRHLLYLEAGMIPARYQVMRQMLNQLQYILQQPLNSLIERVYQAQRKSPIKGDWASETDKIIKQFDLNLSNQEILQMNAHKYKSLVRKKSKIAALTYLLDKQQRGKKGKYIEYKSLQMADYLLPKSEIPIEEKIELFSIRTEINNLPCNFGISEPCYYGCLEIISNEHVFMCPVLNSDNPHTMKYEYLLNGNIAEKKKL